MSQQKNYRTISLIVWSILYVELCLIFIGFIDLDLDFNHRIFPNLYGSFGLLSIPLWIALIVGFSKFNGSSEKWWSKLLFELFPYPDKKPHGSVYRDIIFPTLYWSCLFLIFGPVLFFIAIILIAFCGYILLYNPVNFIFQRSLLGFIIFVSLLTIALILMTIHKNEISRSNIRYDYLAVLITLFCVNIYIIGYFLLIIGMAQEYSDISSLIFVSKAKDCDSFPAEMLLFKLFINPLPGVLVLYYCKRKLNCFLYAEDSYYLYLRSFQFDDKEDSLLEWLPTGGKQIMKIGNPSSSLFSNILSNGTMYNDVLFLPSSNWKKHLDYYIYKAFSVISVVDNTHGVVWEMFHHSEYYHKIVFYVDSNEKLCKLEAMVVESNDFKSSPLLYYCINHLNKLKVTTPFVFWIKGNRCYYDSVNIVSLLLSTRLDCTSKSYFDIDISLDETISKVVSEDTREYKRWNKASSILSLVRKTFSIINSKLPLGLYALTIIGLYLLWIIIPVWFAIDLITQGDILNGIFVIVLGLGLGYVWYKQFFKSGQS